MENKAIEKLILMERLHRLNRLLVTDREAAEGLNKTFEECVLYSPNL